MSNNSTLKQNQLEGRITRASQDLHKIMRDLQRDCKPYWKFSELERELLDIAHEAGKLTADHSRELNGRRRALTQVKNLKEKIDKKAADLLHDFTGVA
jgi:hypothetical protein